MFLESYKIFSWSLENFLSRLWKMLSKLWKSFWKDKKIYSDCQKNNLVVENVVKVCESVVNFLRIWIPIFKKPMSKKCKLVVFPKKWKKYPDPEKCEKCEFREFREKCEILSKSVKSVKSVKFVKFVKKVKKSGPKPSLSKAD